MAHLQYMPGDPRLVDQLVYELKSKGIFDQFRKECIADVDTRPAYQNLRQRVENSVSTFLSRQTWQPDLNKNQLREKLRKHILDGNYLEQGLERIVDQVVNPKVASVFIPKVEDLVYNYLGIARKKTVTAETSNGKIDDLLPTDLEAVSPGSVKSNDDKNEDMDIGNTPEDTKMDVEDEVSKIENNGDASKDNKEEISEVVPVQNNNSNSNDRSNIPLPTEEIKPENIPPPDNSPPKIELATIELPKEPIISTNIPLPEDKEEKDKFFKPINSDDDDSSSDSSLRRNMSPLTPIRNFNNENSCDAQQGFENDIEFKEDDKKEPSSFKFAIDAMSPENDTGPANNTESEKNTEPEKITVEKKETEDKLAYQFNNQININKFNTPLYEESSNSNNLQIDYESDANSKANLEVTETENNSEDSKKERKPDEKKNSHKSSHRSRDSHKHSSSKDKRSISKQSSSKDSKYDKTKSSKNENKSKSIDKDRSRDRSDRDKKDSKDSSRDSSRHRGSHKSSHKDSKSHKSSSSSSNHKHSSSKQSDDKKTSSSSSQKDKDKSDKSMDKPKDSKSSSHRSDKDRKGSSSSSSKSDKSSKHRREGKDKDKKSKKETDDHYSMSGRNNPNRRSTDRDSNDGSSSSKGSNQPSGSKSSGSKKESKTKSENTSSSGDSTSPSDKENVIHEQDTNTEIQNNSIRIESHLEQPVVSPPRLPFVPDITIKKPKFAANLEEAKRLMKMRKFLDEEQKRMNQEAVLLLEFQANVRPSLSQVYSSIPGPELEFACVTNAVQNQDTEDITKPEYPQETHYTNKQLLNVLNDATIEVERKHRQMEEKSDQICKRNSESNDVNDENSTVDKVNEDIDIDIKNEDESEISDSDERIEIKTEFEITIVAEELSESEELNDNRTPNQNKNFELNKEKTHTNSDANSLHYFAEHEKYNAEIERVRFTNFLKEYTRPSNKLFLINCDSYEENIIRDESKKFGDFEIVTFHKNGCVKLPNTKSVIRNVNLSNEISLPIDNEYDESLKSNVFSPDKSECSFELSDYDAKLEEMVNKTSRQEIMEIILGNVNASPSKMPTIDYFTESKIDNDIDYSLKRKVTDESINSNRHVLTPNKIRKMSTDQISSTTLDNEEIPGNKINSARSKYLGKAGRVGLPRPKRAPLPNSPSSDKSVENYEQSPSQTPNGKFKRTKVQRYDTSDLYKPKLHFLSRRNPVT